MIIDTQLEMSNAQALTATAASTNLIDTSVAGDAVDELYLVVQVSTTLASAGKAATLDIILQTDSAVGFGTATTLATCPRIAEATLVAGYRCWAIRIPSGAKRYLRMYYTVGTENFTSGNIDAFLTMDVQTNENPA